MRTYAVDGFTDKEMSLIKRYFKELGLESSVEGVFWLPVPESLLTTKQTEHQLTCGPYLMALICEEDCVLLEMLVRAENELHCDCIGYASPALRTQMIDYIENTLAEVTVKRKTTAK